jgi:penicillin-binding protein 1C
VDLPPRYASWAAQAGLTPPPRPDGAPEAFPGLSADVRLTVTSPQDGLRLLRDPETPADRATVGLSAVVSPPVPQLVWYVDGRPFAVVDYPYTARWPLTAGEHVIQARLPRAPIVSSPVRVLVQ